MEQSRSNLPTRWGNFKIITYAEDEAQTMPHVVLLHPDCNVNDDVVVRIHSECMTGDLFGSLKCDCGDQLDLAMKMINKDKGCLIYLRQEGRGIGLINKIKAYQLQDQGQDTIESNLHLGFEIDERDFSIASNIMNQLGIKNIKLITNNPEKVKSMVDQGISIVERIPVVVPQNKENEGYLSVKKNKLGHLL